MKIGFLGLLGLVFIALKLAGIGAVATWSWLWVLSPLWIPLAIWLSIAGFCLLMAAIMLAVKAFSR